MLERSKFVPLEIYIHLLRKRLYDDKSFLDDALFIIQRDKKSRNIFEILNIADTPDNRLKILIPFIQNNLCPHLPGFSEVVAKTTSFSISIAPIYFAVFLKNLFLCLSGNRNFEEKSFLAPNSLERHLSLSGLIANYVQTKIGEQATHGNMDADAFTQKTPPGQMYYVGITHDMGRFISQTSDHDILGETLLNRVGVRNEIIRGHHNPAPIFEEIDVTTFDTPTQCISRLADLFGKIAETSQTNIGLRTTLSQVLELSKTRQTMYWEKEHDVPSSIWYRTTTKDLERYLDNESKLLYHAVEVLKLLGVEWEELIVFINENPKIAFNSLASAIL